MLISAAVNCLLQSHQTECPDINNCVLLSYLIKCNISRLPEVPTDVLDDPLLKTQGIPQIGSLSTEKCSSAVKRYALEFESEIWKIEDQLKGTGKLNLSSETFYFSVYPRIFSFTFSFYVFFWSVLVLKNIQYLGQFWKSCLSIYEWLYIRCIHSTSNRLLEQV